VVPDDDHVPSSQESYEEPRDDLSGTRTPPTPALSPSHGKFDNYPIFSVLPDKFARFPYEFHDFRFTSLDLPPLPADRSNFDVHGAINTDQV
jgi:hypothetical protein